MLELIEAIETHQLKWGLGTTKVATRNCSITDSCHYHVPLASHLFSVHYVTSIYRCAINTDVTTKTDQIVLMNCNDSWPDQRWNSYNRRNDLSQFLWQTALRCNGPTWQMNLYRCLVISKIIYIKFTIKAD